MKTLPLALLPLLLATAAHAAPDPYAARVAKVLKATPLIDGHNDWPEALADKVKDQRWTVPLNRLDPATFHTDIERLRAGGVGGQFWSVWVSADLPELQQVKDTLEQIDLAHSFARRYPKDFAFVNTAAELRAAHKAGRVASLLGVEGGGQIDGSLAVLRSYRQLGASYLTLTHARTIAWADSATDNPQHDGLTPFGEAVVHELNRLGMLVDLSHVSEGTMLDALRVTKAPVIFSHSSARAICNTPRNVSDTVLKQVAANGGVVMVNYAPQYVSEARRIWSAARSGEIARYNAPPFNGLYIGDPEGAKKALADWEKANPEPVVTLSQVADHIDHIAKVAGVDHVGIGSDFDGVGSLPQGLSGVQTYPALLAELMRRGWSDADVAKLAGENVLRVMAAAEKVAAGMAGEPAGTGTVAGLDGVK
ncbi:MULTISPECIES: dipeptidase [Sphingobium]|jgi:membrane dipeptidase|uniref:dipeptidase n=1 Tax=Sphingobium TaxID=165695 RepID=UPI000E73A7D2|nr:MULTISPECIES: dipeptidase [Sphingobium]KAA9019169.1 membrane dipeptidase [Sphingobium limneticum]MBU0932913.1 dipeptidase [Alphaproteobacteria bacterium]